MSRNSAKIKEDDAALECSRLREFKHFLKESSGCTANGSSTEMKNCVTRSSTETYSVYLDELNAEILMSIWTHFQSKRCPYYFQLPLLRKVVSELEHHYRNAKDCVVTQQVGDIRTQFDLIKLQKFNINYLGKFLMRLTDNTEAANLITYAEPNAICDGANCNCLPQTESVLPIYAVSFIKNKHRKMEDRQICLERYSDLYQLKQRYSFYGVFDGHSGALAATYATSQLPYLLAEQLKRMNKERVTMDDYRDAFEMAFMKADMRFVQKQVSSGTTAVCALISYENDKPTHLLVAWVGDSQALLVGATASLQLVKPHKPDTPDERKRIELNAGGGSVMFVQGQWRVNGILNVSRSIGDYSVNAVIAEPDFVDVELTKAHDFLVLGTDGLWDHVKETVIIETIYKALSDNDKRFEDIPKLLIELAKDGDSQDNITVVIVLLKMRAQIVEEYKSAKQN